MPHPRLPLIALITGLVAASAQCSPPDVQDPAIAVSPCNLPLPQGLGPEAGPLIQLACNEHRLWYGPFIDTQGRLLHLPLTEAENHMLADDGLRAWQRVAGYWTQSNLPGSTGVHPACNQAMAPGSATSIDNALCRSFILDTPWSAAFISWLMYRAGISDFAGSAAHIDYIAASHAGRGPYRLRDPEQTRIRPGDLICHLRGYNSQLDHAGLQQALTSGTVSGWQSHCDLVVASNPGGNRVLYAIGGNVANAVTLRSLAIDQRGALLPGSAHDLRSYCNVQQPRLCSFNPARWVALLQLRTDAPDRALADGHSSP